MKRVIFHSFIIELLISRNEPERSVGLIVVWFENWKLNTRLARYALLHGFDFSGSVKNSIIHVFHRENNSWKFLNFFLSIEQSWLRWKMGTERRNFGIVSHNKSHYVCSLRQHKMHKMLNFRNQWSKTSPRHGTASGGRRKKYAENEEENVHEIILCERTRNVVQ